MVIANGRPSLGLVRLKSLKLYLWRATIHMRSLISRCWRRFSVAKRVQELKDDYSNITPGILSLTDRHLMRVHNHPLNILKRSICTYFGNQNATSAINLKPNYTIFDELSPIVTLEENFDSILVPPDHVSRKKSDTYYINRQQVLRTHTTAHEMELLPKHSEFITFGDVYRRDEIDQYHYPVFHQMEAVRVFKPEHFPVRQHDVMMVQTANDLKLTLEGLVRHLFGQVEMRWIDAYFPFTFPSFQLEILYQGKWLEMLGCGVLHPTILKNARKRDDEIAWAAGLGLERFAMKLFDIPDVRLFWSEDPRFLQQFKDGSIKKFKPFSKYPVCYKDISFWIPDGSGFEENDLHSLIRDNGGDLIEKVECVDTFRDQKGSRTSKCFRIHFRSLERTLLNEEIDKYQFSFRQQIAARLPVKLR